MAVSVTEYSLYTGETHSSYPRDWGTLPRHPLCWCVQQNRPSSHGICWAVPTCRNNNKSCTYDRNVGSRESPAEGHSSGVRVSSRNCRPWMWKLYCTIWGLKLGLKDEGNTICMKKSLVKLHRLEGIAEGWTAGREAYLTGARQLHPNPLDPVAKLGAHSLYDRNCAILVQVHLLHSSHVQVLLQIAITVRKWAMSMSRVKELL